jgi:hypothetical protein
MTQSESQFETPVTQIPVQTSADLTNRYMAIFHALWNQAVNQPGYVKEAWVKLQTYIEGLENALKYVRDEVAYKPPEVVHTTVSQRIVKRAGQALGERVTTEWTEPDLRHFKEAYNEACTRPTTGQIFIFKGLEYDREYAKYLIEYLEQRFKRGL